MDIYTFTRSYWNFAFNNPDIIKPNHAALYFFALEHCNRLGWKEKFGLPTTMAMEALGMKSYNTYINTFNDLIEFGFFTILERSKNQYSSNIIALSKFNKALDKALDKALIKHATKQSESTGESIDSIDIQYTSKQINNITIDEKEEINDSVFKSISTNQKWIEALCINYKSDPEILIDHLRNFYWHCKSYDYWKTTDSKAMAHFNNWIKIGNPLPKRKTNLYPNNPE
jgi:hypothetical protein